MRVQNLIRHRSGVDRCRVALLTAPTCLFFDVVVAVAGFFGGIGVSGDHAMGLGKLSFCDWRLSTKYRRHCFRKVAMMAPQSQTPAAPQACAPASLYLA